MKRIYLFVAFALFSLATSFGAEIEAVAYNNMIAGISRAREPVVSGRYVVFTASGKARHTAIAFEHEGYAKIHSFQRIVRKDEKGEPQKDADGKAIEPVLFYIAEVPSGHREIRYRMVIDGLWTTDPLNARSAYDYANGMTVSTLAVDYYEIFQTANVASGQVRFTYEGTPGEVIRLAGNFNNWDPFMYEMAEMSPGKYELTLPLPPGTWQYAYFAGTEQLPDTTNHERVYTKDGRVASVVRVQ